MKVLALLVALIALVASSQATFKCPATYPIGPSLTGALCRSKCPKDVTKCLKAVCLYKFFWSAAGYKKKCWQCLRRPLGTIDGNQCCVPNTKIAALMCPTVPQDSCFHFECLPARNGFSSCQKVLTVATMQQAMMLKPQTTTLPKTCCDPDDPYECAKGQKCNPDTYVCY